ncbi:hypothetical protein AB1Y20_002325 [Prymnesium parvum]|uniref:Phosphatidate cytidylyltransferase, mitochondrial n=1 Tax=Prymnesium parvum TaxID=97485 RepID=A0AB34JAY4_PRYPA
MERRREALAALLHDFPSVEAAFAYGSAVYPQEGSSSSSELMTDFIFCTDDAEVWHSDNLCRHPTHYSSLALGGPRFLAAVQNNLGAGVYYNTLVHVQGHLIKYGVVESSRLIDDLRHWKFLYLSGRMHKPVLMLRPPSDELVAAMADNRRSALAVALLLLPQRFNERELLTQICGMSYGGDVRMGVGENWSKVSRIVAGQREHLKQLYSMPLEELKGGLHAGKSAVLSAVLAASDECGGGPRYEQDIGLEARRQLLRRIPTHVRRELLAELPRRPSHASPPPSGEGSLLEMEAAVASVWNTAACAHKANRDLSVALQRSIFRVVRRASLSQTLKGVVTAGPLRSFRYAATKISKRLRS